MIESVVKPILTEMGLYDGREVSVKEAFLKYLEICPNGIGPLETFMKITAGELKLNVKEVGNGDEITDFTFSYTHSKKRDLLDYDPRKNESNS